MIKRTELQMLGDYMEGLNTMIDASGQMIHQFGNIKFMALRDMLTIIKDKMTKAIGKM